MGSRKLVAETQFPRGSEASPGIMGFEATSLGKPVPYRVLLIPVVRKPGTPNRQFYRGAAAPHPIEFYRRAKPFRRSRWKRVNDMTQRKADTGFDFEVLRLGIERRDPDLLLGFYADDARLSIANAAAPKAPPFELRGKAEIAKHLWAAFGQGASHRVEGEEVVGEVDEVRFREICEYPDGSRVVVETTLEMRGGKIFRQVDVVARDARADRETESGTGEAKGEAR
ncbi:MAG TPA: nuclear transport factor 2 family protein [Rubrobacter sp.]|nr:nuclear transport factor 2 family protein [Rubrobacter sp.]